MAEALFQAVCSTCDIVQRLLNDYSGGPDELDSLIFQIARLKRLLMGVDSCDDDILESVSIGLCILEDLQLQSGTTATVEGYQAPVGRTDFEVALGLISPSSNSSIS